MATYTLTDIPRELTDAEAAYLTSLCSDVIRRWDHEAAQPSHVCRKAHGGKLVETADLDEQGQPIKLGRIAQVTRAYSQTPTCHDCGRGLHRPLGNDDTTWLCPNARRVSPAGGPDSAVECGEKR